MKFFIVIFLSLLQVFAEDLYVAQTAVGSGDGSSSGNAKAISFFNTSGNWGVGAGKISAGDTVHFVGTITTAATVQASGTAGNIITLLFESSAKFSAAAWATSGAIVVGQHDYITVDGGSNGLIENTANGTSLANHVDSTGVALSSANHCTVKNLAINNLYVRTSGGEQNDYGAGIQNTCTGSVEGFTDFHVTNCTIHDCYDAVSTDYGIAGVTTVEVDHCTIYNANWGCKSGDRRSGATLDGFSFHDNNVHDWANWDDTTSNSFHHNGFFIFSVNGGTATNITVYNNVIGPNFGGFATSGVFQEGGVSTLIYNNVFLGNTSDGPANGYVTLQNRPGKSPVQRVYNNTIVAHGTGFGIYVNADTSGIATVDLKNNLIQNASTMIVVFSSGLVSLTADYNIGYNPGGGASQAYSYSTDGSGNFKTFSQWQSSGFDAHGKNTNPNLDANYVPQSGSPAIDAGISESTYFTVDKNGVARPQGSAWDIGAFEFVSGTTPIASSSAFGNVKFIGNSGIR